MAFCEANSNFDADAADFSLIVIGKDRISFYQLIKGISYLRQSSQSAGFRSDKAGIKKLKVPRLNIFKVIWKIVQIAHNE